MTGGFDLNSASAAWRALLIRSRSSPRGWGCCRWLSKICSKSELLRDIEMEFVNFCKLHLGGRDLIRKRGLAATRTASNVSTK